MEYHTLHKTALMKMAGKSAGSLVPEHSLIQHVPLFFSIHYILLLEVTFFLFCPPNSVISFHLLFLALAFLNLSFSLKPHLPIFPQPRCEVSHLILQRLHANMSHLEWWEINNQPTVQGQ